MKLKIDNELLIEEFFEDTHLLGIMAPLGSHQFVWQVNHGLRFDFRVNNDIEIHLNKKNRQYFFSVFEYKEPNIALSYFLYKNQFDGEYLLPEFKHLDYLWLTKGDLPPAEEEKELIAGIRTIQGVQLVVELTNEKIKNKQHLIL
ncbi:MAG: IPExxxVDY family protein [Chitinophagaceae bacterium]|nr:IPExxxVDY family protein [Chitinophagaceae bacterium]